MIPFASVFVKPVIARQKAQKIIERLDQAIREAERQERRSLLDGLAGVERFNAAAAHLEATLLVRAETLRDAAGRAALLSRYLQRLQEEYEMARNDLKQVPASRAEVVALGLALKEVALSLDTELAQFRGTADQTVREVRSGVAGARDEALQQVERAAAELDGRLVKVQTQQEQRLQAVRATLETGLEAQRGALDQTREALHGSVQALSNDLHGRIASHHALYLQRFADIQTEQAALRTDLAATEKRLLGWIYGVLALASCAFLLAAAALSGAG